MGAPGAIPRGACGCEDFGPLARASRLCWKFCRTGFVAEVHFWRQNSPVRGGEALGR
jgi:hypothetical protein